MWVIFFHETPHFWLIGGETYRVGKKDCHVVIQDDRSISRTHLTITVGVASSGDAAADACSDQPTHILPQPITLTDSSTYGTSVVAAGEEGAGEEETHDSGSVPGASAMSNGGARTSALDTGIVGLRYASGAFARSRTGSGSGRGGSVKKSGPQPILPLPKGQPYTVPVDRAEWGQFSIQLGHHGATLRLVWVDVPVLCEDVDVEMQTKLEHALRCCGARQEMTVAAPPAPLSDAAATPHATPDSSGPLREPSRNTLSERSAPDVSVALAGAPPLPALLGGSSVLTLSQRTSVAGTPSLASTLHATQVAAAPVGGDAGACYNNVAFLVTSTVQPSTAVVGMLCRAVPVVTPAFFVAIRDRASPQVPLPDPKHFLPPPSAWWCDLIQHARLALSATPTAAAGDSNMEGSGPGSADTSSTVSPSAASVQPPKPLAAYFAPDVRRCSLFSGITFVVVQRVLYDELLSYVECTGAAVVWEGGLGEWVATGSVAGQQPLTFSPQGFAALQAFFARHRCHVLLYDATEEMPFTSCLPVLQHSLGLCSVEYAALIESIVVVHPPPLSDYPDTARTPQTEEEVLACVRQARGETSSAHDSDTEDSEYDATTQAEEATEGRRTDAQPLFPDAIAPGAAPPRKSSRVSGRGPLHGDVQLHKRQRKEDAEGWVTLGRPVGGVANGAPPSSNTAAPQVSVRTAEIHFSPYALPSYPCFAELARATTAGEAASAAVHPAEQCKSFVKQALPAAEPLVELEEHRARRQLASSMLVARVPTVDADSVVPEQVVMGGGALNVRAADAAFNTFDTVVHNAASRRRGTTARRGRGGARANATTAVPPASVQPSTTAPAATASDSRAMVDVDGAVEVDEAGSRGGAAGSSTFHIFDIDGIF